MDTKEFFNLIDLIYKGKKNIPWAELNQEPNKAQFIGGLIKDLKFVRDLYEGDLGKKGGISGKGLPISIKIVNRHDENPALEKYTGYDNRWIVVYFGISPELENFVSIVMWPAQSESSKRCYEMIYENLRERKKTLMFEGAYYLYPPNEIRPQNVKKIEAIEDSDKFFDWQYFPFIKDTGDTLSRPISAINYRRVLLRNSNNELYEDYITLRVVVASVLDMKGNQIKVKMPFFKKRPHPFTFNLRHKDESELKVGNIYYFLLMYRAGEHIPFVYKYQKINRISALAHTTAHALYYRFLNSSTGEEYKQQLIKLNNPIINPNEDNFKICSLNEFKDLFEHHRRIIYEKVFYDVNSGENPSLNLYEYIYQMFLSPYFKIDAQKNIISYKPPIFNHDLKYFTCKNILKINKMIKKHTLEL